MLSLRDFLFSFFLGKSFLIFLIFGEKKTCGNVLLPMLVWYDF